MFADTKVDADVKRILRHAVREFPSYLTHHLADAHHSNSRLS
jgi:hypothetical protein